MWWTNPWWLSALILVIPVLSAGDLLPTKFLKGSSAAAKNAYLGRHRSLKRLTLLRGLAVLATVLALAGTTALFPSNHRQLMVLLDTSSSVELSRIEAARAVVLRLIGTLKPKDRVAVVSFAGEPRLIIPFSEPETVGMLLAGADLAAPNPGATDLQAALRFGKELLADTHGNRSILLLSDGRPTTGGPVNIVSQNMGGIRVDVIPIGSAGSGLFSEGLELPENVHPGEPALGFWKVITDRAQTVSVTVKLDNRTVSRKRIPVAAGRTKVSLELPGQKSGSYQVMVEAADEQGRPLSEANAGGVLQVRGPAQVIVVSGGPLRSPLGKALQTQGMDVEFCGIEDLPETGLGLAGYAAMVLDNVPALYLTEAQQTAIQSYVAGGGGLLVVGGDSSLGRGEYYATGLEDLLPVQTDTRRRLLFTRANILFVIDHSGSMSEMVGGTSKQLAAMQGVLGAVQELNPVDEVGILAFDTMPTWVLPFTPVSRQTEIRRALSEIGQGGETDLSTALEEINNAFRDRGPVRRHTVILTDGLTSSGADFKQLVDRLKIAGVSVTTIGIGKEINEELLRNIATWGDGQYYRADLDQIPRVILEETLRVTRDLVQEGSFQLRVRTKAPFLNGLDQNLPPINGYLITKPKNLATVYLESDQEDPLLAAWRYGSGQVAVFTGDSGGRWLTAWSGTDTYNRLWSQLIRSLERGSSDAGLRVRTGIEAGNILIEVEAIGADRRIRTGLRLVGMAERTGEQFEFHETSPGHYQALIALEGAGLHTFLIRDLLGGEQAIGWVWNRQGVELQNFEPDLFYLGQLAATSGGKVFNSMLPELPKPGWAWKRVSLQNYLIFLALLFLIIDLAYRSASLGQMKMAQALLEAWWAAQARLMEMMHGFTFYDNTGGNECQRINEAYRYLAERSRRDRGVD